jgi:hypothetical protein
VDEKHGGGFEIAFVLARVDAVDRADVNARRVFGADARFRDDVSQLMILLRREW